MIQLAFINFKRRYPSALALLKGLKEFYNNELMNGANKALPL